MKKTLQLAILALFPLALSAKPVGTEAVPPQDTLRVDTLGEIVVNSQNLYLLEHIKFRYHRNFLF